MIVKEQKLMYLNHTIEQLPDNIVSRTLPYFCFPKTDVHG